MCDILVDSVCRLCLKENFTLRSIFSCHTPCGEPVFRVLNNIYDLKICDGDGLPTKICVPCLWKMLEFDIYKKNVSYAEEELKKLFTTNNINSNEASEEGSITGMAQEMLMSDEANIRNDVVNETEVSIKHEIDIEEWKMPEDIQPQRDICKGQSSGTEHVINGNNTIVRTALVSSDVATTGKGEVYNNTEGVTSNEELKELQLSTGNESQLRDGDCDAGIDNLEELQSADYSEVTTSVCLEKLEDSYKEKGTLEILNGISEINDARENSYKKVGTKRKKTVHIIKLKSEEKKESEICYSEAPVLCKKKDYICDLCNKIFQCKSALGRHITVHYNDRPYKCTECDLTFKYTSSRREHLLRHLKERKIAKGKNKKPYSCDICKKEFSFKRTLRIHSNLHTSKFSCSFCGKNFSSHTHLKMHTMIHTKYKPFACEVCRKCFTLKGHLNKHMATHSQDRPFQCSICDKRFKTQTTLYHHEIIHFKNI